MTANKITTKTTSILLKDNNNEDNNNEDNNKEYNNKEDNNNDDNNNQHYDSYNNCG